MRHEAEERRRGLVPRLHEAACGTPYLDEELDVAQSPAHRAMVGESIPIFTTIAHESELLFLSDEPIWYLHPESDEQKAYYGDLVLARAVDRTRITAADLSLVIEVVSTNDRRKELKDTQFQRLLNMYNDVPEFALVFPEPDDARALTWNRLVDGQYQEQVVAPGGRVRSSAVPGLELVVLPREQWAAGYKLDVYYRGALRPRLAAERERAEHERARAEKERARAEKERARAEKEQARAEKEQARAEKEQARAEKEQARAAQEKARADRLAERLRALGIDPDDER